MTKDIVAFGEMECQGEDRVAVSFPTKSGIHENSSGFQPEFTLSVKKCRNDDTVERVGDLEFRA